MGYVSRAFELTRQFLFKWTVNWRFVGEEWFLSRKFSLLLLTLHLVLLGVFATTVWLRPSRSNLPDLIGGLLRGQHRKVSLSSSFVLTTMLTSLAIGLLCARSLHYQFFAYLAWATPFLLWQGGYHPTLIYAIWGLQEWAWNTYPSTNLSSSVVVMSLAAQVFGVLLNSKCAVDGASQKKEHRE